MITKAGAISCPMLRVMSDGVGAGAAHKRRTWRTKALLFPNMLFFLLPRQQHPVSPWGSRIFCPSAVVSFSSSRPLIFSPPVSLLWLKIAKGQTRTPLLTRLCLLLGSTNKSPPSSKGPRCPEGFPQGTTRGRKLLLPGYLEGKPVYPTLGPTQPWKGDDLRRHTRGKSAGIHP